MSTERPKSSLLPLPPKWWHDAIRKNFAGNQVNDQRFESTLLQDESGIRYTVISITEGEPDKHPEGIYVAASPPAGVKSRDPDFFIQIISPIRNMIIKESENQNTRDLKFVDEKLSTTLSNMGAWTDLSTAIGLGFIEIEGSNDIIISLNPVNNEFIKNSVITPDRVQNIKDALINKYFVQLSYFERIRLLNGEDLTPALKIEILNIEMLIGRAAVLNLSERFGVNPSANRENDPEYRLLFAKILDTKNGEEEMMVQSEFVHMGVEKTVGWFKFYERYWSEKLGVQFPVDTPKVSL